MALVDIATYKAELEKIRASLEIMWATPDVKSPKHPLRNLMSQFFVDPETGQIKVDTPYVDRVYAGDAPARTNELDSTIVEITVTPP